MALSIYKTFIPNEVLTAADLNALQSHFTGNALTLISPLTGNLDVGGNTLIMDSDGDSSYRCTSTNIHTFRVGGVDLIFLDGSVGQVTGMSFFTNTTGQPPIVQAYSPTDTNVDLNLAFQGTGTLSIGSNQVKPLLKTYGVNSADQNIVAGNETNITGLTGLSLPNTSSVTSRTYLVIYTIGMTETSGAGNFVVFTLYSGANGNKTDTPIYKSYITLLANAIGDTGVGMFMFTPANSSDTKVGLSVTSAGNSTVLGTTPNFSTIRITEVL